MHKRTFYLILIAVVIMPLLQPTRPSMAQGILQWTPPKQITNYNDQSRPPLLAADPSGVVHAFNYEIGEAGVGQVLYRHWSAARGWSPPVDIILPEQGSGSATIQGVYADPNGILHLIYFDGNQDTGDIYYTHAYAPSADRAQAWSMPVPIGGNAGPVVNAAITGDEQGRLIVLYGGQRDGIGVYEVHSLDGGSAWTDALLVSGINEKERWPFSIKTTFDANGALHAVWGVVNKGGVGEAVRYIQSTPDLAAWGQSAVLATREGDEYSTTWPSITVRDREVMVVYQDSFPATKWMALSRDGGKTWQPPVRPFPEVGEYENAVLVQDSSQAIYLILGNRTVSPEIHGMWFSRWLNNRWSALEAVVSGAMTPVFDPSAPQAVVSQGNLLLAAWWHNVRNEDLSGAWFSYTYLDAPALPATILPTATPLPGDVSAVNTPAASAAAPTPTTAPSLSADDKIPQPTRNPAQPIVAGIVPVALLVAGFLILRARKTRHP